MNWIQQFDRDQRAYITYRNTLKRIYMERKNGT